MKRLRFYWRFFTAFISKYFTIIILGGLFGSISFMSSPKLASFFPKNRSIYSIAMVGRFTQTDIPQQIQQQISFGLTFVDTSGIAVPALASSWEITDEGKTYNFKINESILWQDGSKIKSKDINYQFRDAQISYPDDGHLVIKLKDPFSPLTSVVAKPVFKSGLLGLGSYKVTSIKRNGNFITSLTLIPVDKKINTPKLVYHFYPSSSIARTAFKLGQVDTIVDLTDISDLSSWPNVRTDSVVHTDRFIGVFFNNNDQFMGGSNGKNIRQALAYGIDKSRFNNRAFSPISPNSWAYNSDVKKYEYSVQKAKDMLSKSDKLPPEINISTVPAYLSIAESIQKDWQILGLKVNVATQPDINDNFQVLVIAQAIPQDPDQYNLWHSTQATNITHYHNPRIDKLLEDGRKISDFEQRKSIYLDFQRFLGEDVPVIFLFHPTTYNLSKK